MSDQTIVKSNALVEASYRLSVQEQRIMLAAIAQVSPHAQPTDEIMYTVSAHDFIGMTGQSLKHAYQELKDAALRLMRREVRIFLEPNGGGKKTKVRLTRWVQTIGYVEDEGKIELRFGKDVLPYLCQLREQFTVYNLRDVAKMTSGYGIRLYEMLAQWKKVGQKEITIEWLRHRLQLEDKYPNIRDLKRRVIDPAIADINNTSDLWVKVDQRKTGRRVTHLCFTFGPKSDEKPEKKRGRPKKINIYDDKFLAQHANPGESREAAIRRLKAIHG